ncbi:MAG: hypothetical protein H7Z37_00640 [Pyrinomonadaceae bacterium]|nr:hypothetical protein [Pyrinomonadaceae bacterium]
MSQTIYKEKRGSLKQNRSLYPFINAMMPILRGYGLTGEWRQTYQHKDDYGNVESRESILGDKQNAYLKHSNSFGSQLDSYSGDRGYENFNSYKLIHPTTGEKLNISIRINRLVSSKGASSS